MSYKFQRLREKLRQAVASGELSGKLPGERALAKRFHVNAKTLSKALTDLAAEGVLDRSIGRGTYVKGSAPAPTAPGRWLVLCDAGAETASACLVDELRRTNPDLHTITSSSVAGMRPSFLNAFGAVIDMAADTPETFLRDLVVRNLPVVVVNREPKTYSTHAVLVDAALGAARIGRDLMIAGHRRLVAVEPRGSTTISHALRQAARRYNGGAEVDTCLPADMEQGRGVSAVIENGVTAVVCDCVATAERVKRGLERQGLEVPAHLSLAAVGCLCSSRNECPCSGYFSDCVPVAEAVVSLLRDNAPARPTTLWMAGEFIDRGTIGPAALPDGHSQNPSSVFRFGDAVA
jgi:DNA-binding transcriptional regulator YhcF (GntR family)